MTTKELELVTQRQLAQSKLRYADLFDFAPIGYATLNSDGSIEEVNLAAARLLGGTPHQFIKHPFEEFVADEDKGPLLKHLERCRCSAQRLQTELRLRPWDGEPVIVELYTVAAREIEQGKLQFRCAIVNITERKRTEEALHRSQIELEMRAKHHFLSEASAVFSASLDYSTVLENIVRMSIPRLADCCVVDMVQPDGSLVRSAVAHVDRQKEAFLWELGKDQSDVNEAFGKSKVIRTARSEVYAEITDSLLAALARSAEHLAVLREMDFRSYMCVPLIVRGKSIGAVGFMRVQPDQRYSLLDLAIAEEFTDRAAMAIDNAMLYSKEQDANRLKDEFLAIVSHELRTPLTPILGAIYHLRSIRPNDREIQVMADIVERNARKQSRLVEDLLDVSRVATGKFELNRRSSDLHQIIENAVEVTRPAAEALGIRMHLSIDDAPQQFICDPERLQQAIWNLLSNATKFSSPGGLVRIRTEAARSVVRIAIADEGQGISWDFLPHVFEPFRQADRFSTRSHGGLGLGLSIARHIVQQHGGRIRAESGGEGKGATFIVELPYSRGSADDRKTVE